MSRACEYAQVEAWAGRRGQRQTERGCLTESGSGEGEKGGNGKCGKGGDGGKGGKGRKGGKGGKEGGRASE